ncbi:hypothetical protein [Vallicoccus soli]|uniref:Uncharacterized protein n=1 Tax=Vallicoccus soli TaxID=2339232 RepID=A0A3A3Z1C6_9ACTN|nr:hypothetical protein [Vallicoccus soli]RJK96307.1 hypothetical protein D5H78_08625 [Vallicoccus soli]
MDEGVQGVQVRAADGRRSSTRAARAVLAAAARPVDPALAERVLAEPRWRQAYARHVRDLVVAGRADPVAVARAGLAAAQDEHELDGRPVREAVRSAPAAPLGTVVVRGEGERERELALPHAGGVVRGDALLRLADAWVARDVVEPSVAAALRDLVAEPERLDLAGRTVALLGAGAEMSPYAALTRWGASVVAVDLPRPDVQRRLLATARAGAGRVVLPVRGELADEWTGPDALADGAGADLLTEAAAVRDLLARQEGDLVVGNHAYAPGAAFVRLAVAADAVVAALLEERAGTGVASLATPTDAYAVPPEVVAAARARWRRRGPLGALQAPVRVLSRGRAFRPAYADGDAVADVLVVQQGPNYALAKALQRWRGVVAQADGVPVSVGVAPPTATRSVLQNRVLAAAYSGARRFGVETFAPATAATLMAALLVHDLTSPPPAGDLLAAGAAHGGLWRLPYEPRSVLPAAVALGARHLLGGRAGS